MIRFAPLLALSLALAGPAVAAGPVDPDWPCIQRRQPQLSLAQVWGGPELAPDLEARAETPRIRQLAQLLAQRRVTLDEARAHIAAFAKDAPPEDLPALFLATFERIQSARNQVMAGITLYAHKQEVLDAEIKSLRQEFSTLMAVEEKDFDAINKVEETIDWSTRIFLDRQQSLTYVCETPVILEQRIFALGRIIEAQMKQ